MFSTLSYHGDDTYQLLFWFIKDWKSNKGIQPKIPNSQTLTELWREISNVAF